MGCDIHFYVEELKEIGKWTCLDKTELVTVAGHTTCKRVSQPFYTLRNYDLFSILADVRNPQRGFMATFLYGLPRREKLKFISHARGLPQDVTKEIQAIWQTVGGHSVSWLTLDEILNFDWNQTTQVSTLEFDKEQPTIISSSLKDIIMRKTTRPKRRMETVTYKELAPKFWSETIPRLKKINEPNNIRLVFWFDD